MTTYSVISVACTRCDDMFSLWVALSVSGWFHWAAQTVGLKRIRTVLDRCQVDRRLSVLVISSRFLRIAIL